MGSLRTGCRRSLLASVIAVSFCAVTLAQGQTYNLGRKPTPAELRAADLTIGPEGKELPAGSGTAKQGALVYTNRGCAGCHGPTQTEGPAPELVGGEVTLATNYFPVNQWAYAPLIWDFINRAMPFTSPGYLSADEVYSLTALLLYRNGIIQEGDVMDAKSLPKVQMPNRRLVPPPPWKHGAPRPFVITP